VGEPIAAEYKKRLEDTAAYLVRHPLSLEKLRYLDGQQAVVYRSRMNPAPGRDFEAMDPLERLARISDHIPDSGAAPYGLLRRVLAGAGQASRPSARFARLPASPKRPAQVADAGGSRHLALAKALYVEAGIRSVEIGTVIFGLRPDGTESPGAMDLVRLAIPRRVYTQSHIDYVAKAVIGVAGMKDSLRGYRITKAPSVLRHFTAVFEPLAA
jgi:hypothetical protein